MNTLSIVQVIFYSFSNSFSSVLDMSAAKEESPDKKYMDEYDDYNIEQDKLVHSHQSGKGRSKKETEQHIQHTEHTRKNVQKLMNNAQNQKK